MRLRILVMVMAVLLATATLARSEVFQATLTGYEEVPVVSTVANGLFYAVSSGDSIFYSLWYTGLQAGVTQAHIHIAQPGVNGSIIIFLCQTATNPDQNGSPACLQDGTVSGTITAKNVIAAKDPAQQFGAGDIQAAITAMRAGKAYANVHTTASTGGEIRGQIRVITK
jgi:CHRD domain